jgi:hypothetical protein
MNKLPIEIHLDILWRLEKDGLHAMSRVSKYYREIAEPIIYRDLVFDSDHYFRIGMLFLTILDRPDPALLIKSVRLIDEDSQRVVGDVDKAYHLRFWNKITAVRDLIESFAMRLNIEIVSRWFSSIYAGRSSFDGALAAILCLAIHLERLDLQATHEPLTMTTKLIGWNWDRIVGGPDIFPFYKLKHICMCGTLHRPIPVLPSLETMSSLYNSRAFRTDQFLDFPYPRRAVGTYLRALEMNVVFISPTALQKLFSSPELCNIKELKISGIRVTYHLHGLTTIFNS